ncbi:MAG: LPS export ABC transporter periplasmic protein LptC [Bacteroidales bacterium]|nr:LPS export ABC transporter periplasmic protein LptC [Lentimicrobiaceae bacterium]MDD5694756.1 LPS export ABC transporter periplasmic protein LptC [Bacteroidales bacterium]
MKRQPSGLPVSQFIIRILILAGIIVLSSCENDIRQINMTMPVDTLPVETIYNIEIEQSERGKLSLILTGPLMESYGGDDPYIEFPKGVHIVFYDTLKRMKSELRANYGISYEKRNIMEAHGDVEVINHLKNERLNTEHLIWDRNKKIIYSEVFVRITTTDKTIYGENGMTSDELFESWKLRKVRGDIRVSKEKF